MSSPTDLYESDDAGQSRLRGEREGRPIVMTITQILTGGDRNFGYVLADEGSNEAALVDPSYAPERLVKCAEEAGYRVRYILVTHDHDDHTNGNARAKALTGAKVVMHRLGRGEADVRVDDGDTITLGRLSIRALHTPGHNPAHVCYYVGDAVFTGDTLFVGKVGGTDFGEQARQEYESLHGKLLLLPGETRVFPGHNYGLQSESTIAHERETNPFLLQPDFASFVDLKRNWAEYKRTHGIP